MTAPPSAYPLDTPLEHVKGVGPERSAALAGDGMRVLEDLLLRLPLRYEDRSRMQPIAAVQPGETVALRGQVLDCRLRRTRRRGFTLVHVVVGDGTGRIEAVFINQPFLTSVFASRRQVVVYGTAARDRGRLQMTNPDYELIEDADAGGTGPGIHTTRIVPVYLRVGCVSAKQRRRIVYNALAGIPEPLEDPLPARVREEYGLPPRREAFISAHFPPVQATVADLNRFRTPAQRRLIFEECFFLQVGLARRRRALASVEKPHRVRIDDRVRRAALEVLPFRLTGDQKHVLREIVGDLERSQPMNRLLQGDVGSGKTIVALLAALVAMENGLQVAVMTPTEILAAQHYATMGHWLEPSRFEAALVVGSQRAVERRNAWQALETGRAQLVVGTHTLVQDAVRFERLGLVIIDEQHRFGVSQRAALRHKGLAPDVLVMTATPIPRTLVLTAYGDLDTSVIRELPPGRMPVETTVRSVAARPAVYRFVREQTALGRQAYVVAPLVDDSETTDLQAVTRLAEELQAGVLTDRRVALVHGRLAAAEREKVMQQFVEHRIDVLVATTVIEVGVDVPNAAVMVVEHAERFGLAQLHQLRGRVGRGPHRSHCILVHDEPLAAPAAERLRTLARTADGFVVAEQDLALRGPGDVGGIRQSGRPLLEVGDLLRDASVMRDARRAAQACIDAPWMSAALTAVRSAWVERFGLVEVG